MFSRFAGKIVQVGAEMIREGVTSDELYSDFIDKVQTIMARLQVKYDELKDLKETERTRAFWTKKIIDEWFDKRGRTK